MMLHVLASGEQVLGMPGTVAVALIGAVTAAAGVWGSRRSSSDAANLQRDQNTWERMESLLAERDRSIERLERKVASLERALSESGLPVPE